jgi:translation initiation factor IF-1
MARIRTIKPDFFLDDEVAALNPLTRILFIGLWCLADKAGRLEDKPQKIKVQILPYDKYDVDKELDVLAEKGFILRYQVEGVKYIQVISFNKHQAVHGTERESIIPVCNGEITVKDHEECVGREGKGREGKGKILHGDAVTLKPVEYEKLVARYGEDRTAKAIEILDNYIMSKGKKYNSHYHTLLGWPMTQAGTALPQSDVDMFSMGAAQ